MSETSVETAKLAELSDEQWVALHVPRFLEIRPRYLQYADFLKAVIQNGSNRLAPLAIIEARAKSIPSFAEKILRSASLTCTPGAPRHWIRWSA